MNRQAYRVAPAQQVLIALMPDYRDFAIARERHWYRIPVKSAPGAVVARHIAFYHSAKFGDQSFAVRWWAEITKRSIVKRRDLLPDEPTRADADYYKLELSALRPLVRPIISRRKRRIMFVPTTWSKFEQAEEINDLFHESPLEDELWQGFKRRNVEAERQLHLSLNRKRYCLDFALYCKRGNIDVECDGDTWHTQRENIARDNQRDNALVSNGWAVLRFNTEQICEAMPDCLSLVRQTITRHGGLVTANSRPI